SPKIQLALTIVKKEIEPSWRFSAAAVGRGDPISPIPGDGCPGVPCCVGGLHYLPRIPSTQEPWSGPTTPSDFFFFPALKSARLGRFRESKLALRLRRTSFSRWALICTRMVS
ncbi:hypothetical protein AVEN_72078-1, partial [Araneus ventricosus]